MIFDFFPWRDIFLSEDFVWWYCAFISALFLTCALLLGYQSLLLWVKLRRARRELEARDATGGLAREFERYHQYVTASFGLPWTEFVETLVLPEPGSDDPIRNTYDVSRYLNDSTIISPRIYFGFFRAVPNLLTGLGILGTFIGLAAGVGAASSGLASSDPESITASLQQLLDGASLAFLTSISGILCSILFVVEDRIATRYLHRAINMWVDEIEARLERVTTEGVALQQLEQARRTTKQLESFNTELVFALEKALDEKVAGRISPQLDRLVEAVERLREDRSTDAGQMIERSLDRFTRALQERTGTEFEEMASIIADLNRTLKASAAGLAQSQTDVHATLSSAITEIKKSMDAGATAMTTTLQQSLDDVTGTVSGATKELAHQLQQSSTAAAAELRDTFGSGARNLAEVGVKAASQISESYRGLTAAADSLDRSTRQSERVLKDMTTFVDRINALREMIESANREIAGAAEPVRRAALEIRASTERTADTLERTEELVGRVVELVGDLEQHQQAVAQAWASYQERFEGIDESLGKVFRQIDEGLSNYCEQVKKFAEELDQSTSNTTRNLSGAAMDLNESIEALLERRVRES